MTQTNHTPGPWQLDRGQIRDANGNALASYPYSLGGEADHANAILAAAAPDLLAAALITLETLANITTVEFSQGADKPAREALEAAIAKATTRPITTPEKVTDILEVDRAKDLALRIRLIAYPGFFTDRFTREKIELITAWLLARGGYETNTPDELAAEWLEHEAGNA